MHKSRASVHFSKIRASDGYYSAAPAALDARRKSSGGIARCLRQPYASNKMISFQKTVTGWKPRLGGSGDSLGFRASFNTTFRRFAKHYSATTRTGCGVADHPDYVGLRNGSRTAYPVRFSLFGFGLCRKYPSRVSAIAADDPRRYEGPGWRIETRGPEDMMKAGGFSGKGTNDDIGSHVHGGIGTHLESRLCSWSKTPTGTQLVADAFMRGSCRSGSLYLYEATLFRHNTFDATKDAWIKAVRTKQGELVCARVGLRDITAVALPGTEDDCARKVLYPFWPRNDLSMERSVRPPDPFVPDTSAL
jgi:hypothetical protein